jgi:hypothetical protein
MGSIQFSAETRQKIKEANEKRNSKSLAEVVKDIRKERKERQLRAVKRMMQKK